MKKSAIHKEKRAKQTIKFDNIFKSAFTLAEVLITITVIGIVAAIVMPQLLQNVSERIYSHREANIANKITSAMEVMITTGNYGYFTTTEEFVEALKKHLNIVKVCDNAHLTECWPTTKVRGADGKPYNVADATTGRKLHTKNTTNTMGLVLNDGAALLLTFNPDSVPENDMASFIPSTKTLPVGFGNSKEFAYTSSATKGIDYVVDVNGAAGPNSETTEDGTHDIRSFNIASFTSAAFCTGTHVGGMCVKNLGTKYGVVDCTNTESEDYKKYCFNKAIVDLDWVAGAKKACDELGMELPDKATLLNIAQLYAGTGEIPNSESEQKYWSSTDLASTWDWAYYVKFSNNPYIELEKRSYQFPILCVIK